MKISFSTTPGNLNLAVGFGCAGFNMVKSLQELGHEVPFDDKSALVQIFFSHPEWFDFHPNQYKIGYTPWESSGIPYGWLDNISQCDELWVPSPQVAEWLSESKPPIFVYEHGVEHKWTQHRRRQHDVIRFLHMGEPAPRKGGDLAVRAFRAAFGDRTDVELTIKAHHMSNLRVKDRTGSIIGLPHQLYNNVKLTTKELSTDELIGFVQSFDVFVYPSYGEGFGLMPLQAMATGMPTICTEAWAPYAKLLLPELRLSSTLGRSPWPDMHPGQVYHPDFDHLVELYRDSAANFGKYAGRAFRLAFTVHDEYDWVKRTESAFNHIIEKF